MARKGTPSRAQVHYLMDELDQAAAFGRWAGECGLCGHTLDDVDREAGLCWPCQLEVMEDNDGTQ